MFYYKKIWIFGVPRSGTSWLGQIFNSNENTKYLFQPLFSYKYKNFLKENMSIEDLNSFYNEMLITDDSFVMQKDNIEKNIYPKFDKCVVKNIVLKHVRHINLCEDILRADPDCKMIAIIRNPIDVINSWVLAPKEFDKKWNIKEWRLAAKKNCGRKEEFYGFERWKEATKIFLNLEKKYKNFKIIKYSDLTKNCSFETKSLFNFCDISYSKFTEDFINESSSSHNDNPYSVFKSKKKKIVLNQHIISEIKKELYSHNLEIFLK